MGRDMDNDYQKMHNPFTRHLVFSILEILSIWPLAVICGIVACVYTAKANTSYLDGRIYDFQHQNKNAKTSLWLGFASYFILLIFILLAFLTFLASKNIFSSVPFENSFSDLTETQIIDDITGKPRNELISDSDKSYSIDRERRYDESYLLEDTILAGYNQFTWGGAQITLPMSYNDFLKLNLKHDTDRLSTVLNPSKSGYVNVYDENDEYIGNIYLSNNTSKALPMSECIIDAVEVRGFVSEPEVELIHGINFDTSVEELIDYFGIPDKEYHSKENAYFYYSWCAPLYGSNLHDTLVITFTDERISEIYIGYNGMKED